MSSISQSKAAGRMQHFPLPARLTFKTPKIVPPPGLMCRWELRGRGVCGERAGLPRTGLRPPRQLGCGISTTQSISPRCVCVCVCVCAKDMVRLVPVCVWMGGGAQSVGEWGPARDVCVPGVHLWVEFWCIARIGKRHAGLSEAPRSNRWTIGPLFFFSSILFQFASWEPPVPPASQVPASLKWCPPCLACCVCVSGRGVFTAVVEVAKEQLVLSFLHHMVVQRNVRNPFEDKGEQA